jgi:putative spermidine/putrescine transport system permease protein
MEEPSALEPADRRYRALGSVLAWLVYLFLIAPSLIVLPISFGDQNEITFPPRSLSLYLYRDFLFGSNWLDTAFQSFRVAAAAAAIAIIAGTLAAYALARLDFPGRRLVHILLVSPALVPAIVIALGLYLYFAILGLNGTTFGLVLAHAVQVLPFVVIAIGAGLRDVDPTLERAATIMGAGTWHVLRRVTLPLLRSAIAAAALFAFLISFDEVVIAYFVTNTATMTLPVKMYSSLQFQVSPVIAAVSSLLTLLSLVICIAAALLQGDSRD